MESPVADSVARGGIPRVLAYPGLVPVYAATLFVTGGQWIQNVVLAAYAYDISGSAIVVGLVMLAQLGPLFVVGLFAGAIADAVDRRKLLRIAVTAQAVTAALIALASSASDGPIVLLILPAIACGTAQTFFLSSYTSLLPLLVPAEDLRQTLALNAALLSMARVVGPAIGAVLYAVWGQVVPLALVAALYLFVVLALGRIPPLVEHRPHAPVSLRGLTTGFRAFRRDAEIRRVLTTIALFSLVCLPFLNQMPVVAEQALGVGTKDGAYSLIFVAIGVGSLVGGVLTGTVLLRVELVPLTRWLLCAFGVLLGSLAVIRSLPWGLTVLVALGLAYFGVVTTLITRLQMHLADEIRGRVMALWFMGFGGLLPVGAALAGPLIDHASVSMMIAVGAAAAIPLGWYAGRPAAARPVGATEPEDPLAA